MKMRIRYVGPKVIRRLVGPYEWSRETGFVQDVQEAELAAELLTDPSGRFVLDDDEPLLEAAQGDADQVIAWAMEDVDESPRQRRGRKKRAAEG
jgi:hypothetical protein